MGTRGTRRFTVGTNRQPWITRADRDGGTPRTFRTCLVFLSVLLPAHAAAQTEEPHVHSAARAFAVGGEVTAVGGAREDTGFFNNTDYDINTTRMVRLRLFGEWHLTSTMSLVGELRSENAAALISASAYVRWRPRSGRLVAQAGRIPPVFGAYPRRAYGRDNLTLAVPLAYQYLTSLRPDAMPVSIDDVLGMRGRGWQPNFPVGSTEVRGGVPMVSVAAWDTGVEATWETERVDLSAAITRGSPAIPVVRDRNESVSVSGRLAIRGPAGLSGGVSVARGRWIDNAVLDLVPGGRDTRSHQTVLGVDVEIGSGPWIGRAEWIRSRFDVPLASLGAAPARLSAQSGFVEARYRFHPRWQVGARADWLTFSAVRGSATASAFTPWDAPVRRVETVVGFRATRSLEVRAGWQHNWRDGGRVRRVGLPVAGVLYWF